MKGKVFKSIVLIVFITLVFAGGANAFGVNDISIPPGPETLLPDYIGAPAKAHPTANNGVPQNPFLAPNPFAQGHKDIWMSDTTNLAGPLGNNPVTLSTTLPNTHDNSWLTPCGNILFDSHGRIIATCFGKDEASVIMLDPDTLEVLTHKDLDVVTGPPVGEGGQDFPPSMWSIYGYLDDLDQMHMVSEGKKIITLGAAGSASSPEFVEVGKGYDLSELVDQTQDSIRGVMVDFQGRYWINVAKAATVYMLNPATYHGIEDLKSINLGEGEFIRNGFALTKEGAAYIVTTEALYRVDAGADDQPRIVWRQEYETIDEVRPGQTEKGSGTTPTILGEGKYVAITDNAPQMNVVVYRTELQNDPNDQVVCKMPVFEFPGGGVGANWNSLVGSRNSIIIQNTADYYWDWANYDDAHLELPSKPGIERVDIDPNGMGCTKVWVNTESAGVMTLELSTKTGLIYTQDRKFDAENNVYVYYFVAIDFQTGEMVWEKMMGTGDKFDSIGMSISIGPNKALYGSPQAGIVMLKDTP
ncbi:MAG: hypothetical protein C3F13_17150 [Anaerolineales bacterium]|nr:hypothetical protein [Anaerolineae bacterium]PWB50194.1 MAG: hypothetical protein C3F13_17150 [Anaerolineales bacterium]